MEQILYEESGAGITIDRIIRDYEFNMPIRHFHPEYEIYYLVEGERYYFIEKETYHVKAGSLVFINRNQIHKTASLDKNPHDRILLEIEEEPISDYFAFARTVSFPDFFAEHWGVLYLDEEERKKTEALLSAIVKEMQDKSLAYEFLILQKLSELLLLALRKRQKSPEASDRLPVQSPKHDKVQEVAGYLLSHYTEDESLDSLANRFFLSRSYLSRIFREVTGFTVNEYLNIQRIKAAQGYLKSSSLSITEISGSVGYESITYFEKVFRKYNDCSPLNFRKRYRSQVP